MERTPILALWSLNKGKCILHSGSGPQLPTTIVIAPTLQLPSKQTMSLGQRGRESTTRTRKSFKMLTRTCCFLCTAPLSAQSLHDHIWGGGGGQMPNCQSDALFILCPLHLEMRLDLALGHLAAARTLSSPNCSPTAKPPPTGIMRHVFAFVF